MPKEPVATQMSSLKGKKKKDVEQDTQGLLQVSCYVYNNH